MWYFSIIYLYFFLGEKAILQGIEDKQEKARLRREEQQRAMKEKMRRQSLKRQTNYKLSVLFHLLDLLEWIVNILIKFFSVNLYFLMFTSACRSTLQANTRLRGRRTLSYFYITQIIIESKTQCLGNTFIFFVRFWIWYYSTNKIPGMMLY